MITKAYTVVKKYFFIFKINLTGAEKQKLVEKAKAN